LSISCLQLVKELQDRNFKPKKGWGQNFLIDDNIRRFIIENAHPQRGENILEVGGGSGCLTAPLVETGADVFVFEVDRLLCGFLKEKFGAFPNFHLYCQDILKYRWEEFPYPLKAVSNLPYSITGAFFFKLWETEIAPFFLVMVQREVGERLTAQVGTKQYGILTVLFSLTFRLKVLKVVSPAAFWPKPEVESVIIRGEKISNIESNIKDVLVRITSTSFRYRRKKLYRALAMEFSGLNWKGILSEVGIDYNLRPENIKPGEWLMLAKLLKEKYTILEG